MSRMCLDNEYAQFYAQFALMMIVFIDQSLFTVTTIKYVTHNAI
jgi:hypothetical protein